MTYLATRRLLFSSILIMALAAALSSSSVLGEGENTSLFQTSMETGGGPSLIGVYGEIPGRDLFVHIVAVVPPGRDKNDVARDVLRGQGARPLGSDDFSTTGLVWDQFFDERAGNDVVTQYYNPEGDPTGGARIPLLATQSTWGQVAGSIFSFEDGGTTDRCPSLVLECPGAQTFDGKNDVGWVAIGGCCTLGVTWYSVTTDEADMALNTSFPWSVDGLSGYDLETVYLHENGHVAGLGHSNVAGSVMLAYYGGINRSLDADDEAGLSSLYSAPSTNQPPEVSISSPVSGTSFASGTIIGFTASATDLEDGDLTSSISWYSDINDTFGTGGSVSFVLGDGTHKVSAVATDSYGNTRIDTVSVTVGDAPPAAASVTVDTISYATKGGKKRDKHLLVTISLSDETGTAVSGAEVSVAVDNTTLDSSWARSGTTGADGSVTLQITNAPAGRYVTTVTGVVAAGLVWDRATPENEATK